MKRKIALYMIPAVLLILTAIFFLVYNKPHRSVKGVEPAFTVTASELTEAFSNDEVRADSMYTGNVIQVRGPLREMIRNDSTLILMIGNETDLAGVSCFLEQNQIARSENLTPGETVTVKGICNGALMDVVIDHGILMKDED